MFNVGDLVLIITERKDKATPTIGKIEKVASETFVNNGAVSKHTIYKINGKIYGSGDVFGVGDKIIDDLEIFSITNDSVFAEDEDGKYCMKADDFYYCTTCGGLHVDWVTVKYLDDDEPICECADDEFDETSFMMGYITALDEIIKSYDDDDNIIHETMKSFDCFFEDLCEDDYIPFYEERCNILKKPQLTLDEIKEKLGFDFDLVD